MRSWFNRQVEFIRQANNGSSAAEIIDGVAKNGANRAGMWQARFESASDLFYDDVAGPLFKRLGKPLLTFAPLALVSAATLTGNLNPAIGIPAMAGIGALHIGWHVGKAIRSSRMESTKALAIERAEAERIEAPVAELRARFGVPKRTVANEVAEGAAAGAARAKGSIGILPWLLKGIMRPLNKHGIAGLMGATIAGGRILAGGAWNAVRGTEAVARTLLTGGIRGVQGPLDAWFPYFRNTPNQEVLASSDIAKFRNGVFKGLSREAAAEEAMTKAGRIIDPRKYAINPRVVRRLVGFAAIAAVGQGLKEAMDPQVAPPTAFFDGRYMRHVNDMGANAHYAQGILGPNSALGMNYRDMARIAAHAF